MFAYADGKPSFLLNLHIASNDAYKLKGGSVKNFKIATNRQRSGLRIYCLNLHQI